MRTILSGCLAAFLTVAAAISIVQRPRTLNGHIFKLPEGYTIELAAQPPLVDRPISGALDEEGRLYVTISSGSNDRGPDQAKKQPHKIVRLVDTDGDGAYDQSVTYAENLAMPQGAMWHQGSLFVAAPPHILKFTDTDGDGKADKREIWFDGKTVTGCMNDLHGPWLGPDGWIYWTKGAFAPQTYTIHGKEWKTRASHLFRARPDGSGIEPLMTGGMDNPVGLAFTSTGDRIVSGTFFTQPAAGKRDGLIHAVYGGIYGKDWDVLHDPQHIWTGPSVLPMMTHLGPAAACAVTRMESPAFTGDPKRDTLFCCLFNMQKVTRHTLVPKGATYETKDDDFLVSDQKDFHPTDVIEDADGSLLVIDTGGWYKICCPTSQLPRPDVLGAIYRIRRTDAAKRNDPYGKTIEWGSRSPKQLAELLGDSRVFVKRRAIAALAMANDREDVRQALIAAPSVEARRNALWAAARRGDTFDAVVGDPDLAAVALLNPVNPRIVRSLSDIPVSARRAALEATALAADRGAGEISDKLTNVVGLSKCLRESPDPMMDHAVIYALIKTGDRNAAMNLAESPGPRSRRAGLIALDRMRDGKIPEEIAVAALDSKDADLQSAAEWIVDRRPELGKPRANRFARLLMNSRPELADDFIRQSAKIAANSEIQQTLVAVLTHQRTSTNVRIVALRVMAAAKIKETPAEWIPALISSLGEESFEVVLEAANVVRVRRITATPRLAAALRHAGSSDYAPLARLTALAASPLSNIDDKLFHFLMDQMADHRPAAYRALAAETLAKSKLSSDQLLAVAAAFPTAAPMDVSPLLEAFANVRDPKVGRALLAAMNHPNLRSTLRPDQVTASLKSFGPEILKEAEPLVLALNADAAKQQSRLDELLAKIKGGDVARGREVFNSTKTACTACHTYGYLGGKIGPDLTRIGSIRTERDLLEAIVFPSASFVRGYEPVVVQTAAGVSHSGQIIGDAADEVTLATGVNQEVRVSRKEIEEIRPGRVSIMPSGFDQQLSVENLADLVAFLKASK